LLFLLWCITGSITAEHGVGQQKRQAMVQFGRSPEELQVMRTLKHSLDPCGILNPGKVLLE
jgi:FAD/FMN-containing dehydrogenase